jgi:protein-tyrosine-phosphatase
VTFDVAFICTGNRFRSVIAEATFRTATAGLPVHVSSFGTLDVGPAKPLRAAFGAARKLGLDISAHYARCVTYADLSQTSLVVGFEVDHLFTAVAEASARADRCFTLLELVGLLELNGVVHADDPVERAVANVARAHAARGSTTPAEIPDPIGQPRPVQRAIAQELYSAANSLGTHLFGTPPRGRQR